jgi:hypothetical protein
LARTALHGNRYRHLPLETAQDSPFLQTAVIAAITIGPKTSATAGLAMKRTPDQRNMRQVKPTPHKKPGTIRTSCCVVMSGCALPVASGGHIG